MDRAFDGSGVLKCSNPEVRFYLANDGGDPLNIGNKLWPGLALVGGVDVWAESEQPSHAKKDITLTLELVPALVARYTALTVDGILTVTAVRAVLDICYDPVMAGASPTRLAPTVKYDPGRILQPPAAGNQSRACLIVRRVVPADVKAKLTLTVKNGKVRLFKLQTPVANETPRVLPLSVGVPGKGGTVYWVEGVNGSAAPGDAGFELTAKIDGVNYVNVDQAAVTVATVKTTAKIPVTPAKSDRGAEGFSKVPPKYREFTATADHGGNFDANAPLVLLENSVPVNDPVQLTIEVFPAGGTVANLAMIRAIDDHLTLAGLALPTIALVNNTGQLRSDSRGSFHVTADVTINGALQNGLVCLNVVIAGVDLVAESCTTPNPDAGLAVYQDGGCVFAYFQNPLGHRYPDSKMDSPTHPFVVEFASIHMRATATIIGGGPDGKRGVNKILGGWINNLTGLDIRAGYRDLAAANPPQDGRVQFVINRAQANRQPPFDPNEPGFDGLRAPVEAAYSPTAGLLDTGGDQAILSASRYLYRHPDEEAPRIRSNGAFNADTPAAGGPPVLGREVLIDSMDSPATNFDFLHPLNAALYLSRFREWYGFSAYLSFWADGDAVNERLYGVLCRVDWVVDADWTVTWNANPPLNPTQIDETHFVLAAAAAVAVPRAGRPAAVMLPNVTRITGHANYPLASAATTDVEVAGPSTHALKARDYRIL